MVYRFIPNHIHPKVVEGSRTEDVMDFIRNHALPKVPAGGEVGACRTFIRNHAHPKGSTALEERNGGFQIFHHFQGVDIGVGNEIPRFGSNDTARLGIGKRITVFRNKNLFRKSATALFIA